MADQTGFAGVPFLPREHGLCFLLQRLQRPGLGQHRGPASSGYGRHRVGEQVETTARAGVSSTCHERRQAAVRKQLRVLYLPLALAGGSRLSLATVRRAIRDSHTVSAPQSYYGPSMRETLRGAWRTRSITEASTLPTSFWPC
jgi:hypothetical protein